MSRPGRSSCLFGLGVGVALLLAVAAPAAADSDPNEEKPYSITPDGVVDWYTFSGFRRYHADCHVCHGPDGLGSSAGPALVESMKVLSYEDYLDVVVNGRGDVSAATKDKMPAFGEDMNVMCFIDDIYAYLKARSDGVLGKGRPKKERKPQSAKERDNECMG